MKKSLHLPALFLAGVLLAAGAFAQAPAEPAAASPLAALQAAYLRAAAPGEAAQRHHDLIAPVLDRVERSYADAVDLQAFAAAALRELEAVPAGTGEPATVFRKAVNAALRSLDPHSRYLDPGAEAAERSALAGSFVGVGLQVEAAGPGVRVTGILPDTPAARAGLRAGDFVLRVDGESLAGLALSDAIARLRGAPGTQVMLTVQRAGNDDFTVTLTREAIRRQALHWRMEGDVLVLRLSTFTRGVGEALEQALAQATASGPVRGIVLDLRGNGGGLVREAIRVADAFLGEGDIVALRAREPGRRWKADPVELAAGAPLVVLVDRRSASASEIVAAALQENGRAIVMGQRSLGKGTVQNTFPLGAGRGALKLTTAYYLGPSGRSVHRVGVAPDIPLALAPADAASGEREAAEAAAPLHPGRCNATVPRAEPAQACAIALLQAGGRDAFLQQVAAAP